MRLVDVYQAPEALMLLYRLLKERVDDTNITHQKLPSWEEHLEFFVSRPYRAWYLIEDGGAWIGATYVTRRNEVGIFLFDECQGKGLGRRALEALMQAVDPLPAVPAERFEGFVANINPNNVRSIRLFESLGFRHVQNSYQRCDARSDKP